MRAASLLYCDHCSFGVCVSFRDMQVYPIDETVRWNLLPHDIWMEIFKWLIYPFQIAKPYANRGRLVPITRMWLLMRLTCKTFKTLLESDLFFQPIYCALYTDARVKSGYPRTHFALSPSSCNPRTCYNPMHLDNLEPYMPQRFKRIKKNFAYHALKHRLKCRKEFFKRHHMSSNFGRIERHLVQNYGCRVRKRKRASDTTIIHIDLRNEEENPVSKMPR